jgi:hypothetical protein
VYKIAYRYNEKITGFSLAVRFWYKCPHSSVKREVEGFSKVYPLNPMEVEYLHDIAFEKAMEVAATKMTCKSKKSGESRARLNFMYEYLIEYRIQKPVEKPQHVVPDTSYNNAQKKYGKNFMSKKEYQILKKMYYLDEDKLTDAQRKERMRTIIKYREVIQSWQNRQTRKLKKEVGEL